VDTIVWATGYRITFPFLDPGLLPYVNGVPARLAVGTLAPDLAGLYFVGLVTPGGGNFPVHYAQAQLVADMISAQARDSQPLARTAFWVNDARRACTPPCRRCSPTSPPRATRWPRTEPADGRLPRTGQDGRGACGAPAPQRPGRVRLRHRAGGAGWLHARWRARGNQPGGGDRWSRRRGPLPAGRVAVEEVVLDVLGSARPVPALWVDCTSSLPPVTRRLGERLRERGGALVDTP
jgi:hypothetical protein